MVSNKLGVLVAVLGLMGCGSPERAAEPSTESDGPMVSSSDSPTTSTSSTSGSTNPIPTDETSSSTSGATEQGVQPPITDVLFIPDVPPEGDEGCQAIDFMFVIDNSGSMYSYQVNLVNNFPTFSSMIQATLEHVTSYHVGVVSTDAYSYNDAPCGEIGDLVISTEGGFDSSNMVCGPYAEGFNFMTQEDDLDASFACAAQLGTYGDGYERPMDAILAALAEENAEPGECNEGFIRDDALLVIVIITDEYDGPGDPEGSSSMGDPETWYEAVIEAKGGIEQNAAVLSIINYNADPDEEPSPCPGDSYSDGVHIKTFTQMFEENGFVGGICEPDYGPIFEEAIGVIDTACENFVPPG